jgi:hypothetical protein
MTSRLPRSRSACSNVKRSITTVWTHLSPVPASTSSDSMVFALSPPACVSISSHPASQRPSINNTTLHPASPSPPITHVLIRRANNKSSSTSPTLSPGPPRRLTPCRNSSGVAHIQRKPTADPASPSPTQLKSSITTQTRLHYPGGNSPSSTCSLPSKFQGGRPLREPATRSSHSSHRTPNNKTLRQANDQLVVVSVTNTERRAGHQTSALRQRARPGLTQPHHTWRPPCYTAAYISTQRRKKTCITCLVEAFQLPHSSG